MYNGGPKITQLTGWSLVARCQGSEGRGDGSSGTGLGSDPVAGIGTHTLGKSRIIEEGVEEGGQIPRPGCRLQGAQCLEGFYFPKAFDAWAGHDGEAVGGRFEGVVHAFAETAADERNVAQPIEGGEPTHAVHNQNL